jgi:phosphoribosylanthranilate isomerase
MGLFDPDGRVRVKICGITRLDDALEAAALSVDALGFIFAPSPRRVTPDFAAVLIRRLPPEITTVGVFVDETTDAINGIVQALGLRAVQLHGSESVEICGRIDADVIKRIHVHENDNGEMIALKRMNYDGFAVLLDPGSGSGKVFDWNLASGLPGKVMVAGGLTLENVSDAVRLAKPWAVDVSSGVESAPGVKDIDKIRRFMEAVHAA